MCVVCVCEGGGRVLGLVEGGSKGPVHGSILEVPPLPILQAVQNNGSVYVHSIFTPAGASPNPKGEGAADRRLLLQLVLPCTAAAADATHSRTPPFARLPPPPPPPADEFYDRSATFVRSRPLNAYLKKRAAKDGVNLLSGKNSTGAARRRGVGVGVGAARWNRGLGPEFRMLCCHVVLRALSCPAHALPALIPSAGLPAPRPPPPPPTPCPTTTPPPIPHPQTTERCPTTCPPATRR